jgi:hypothetical protein
MATLGVTVGYRPQWKYWQCPSPERIPGTPVTGRDNSLIPKLRSDSI